MTNRIRFYGIGWNRNDACCVYDMHVTMGFLLNVCSL